MTSKYWLAIPVVFSLAAYADTGGPKDSNLPPPPPSRMGKGGPMRKGPPFAGNPNVFERLNRMNPVQRERMLSRLPPERREKIEQGLRRYNALPEPDRDQLRQQFENFKNMPPEQQDALRRNFRQFTALPDDRRAVVRQELMQLRSMTPEQRQQRMNSDEFRSRFGPYERRLLDNFTRLTPPTE